MNEKIKIFSKELANLLINAITSHGVANNIVIIYESGFRHCPYTTEECFSKIVAQSHYYGLGLCYLDFLIRAITQNYNPRNESLRSINIIWNNFIEIAGFHGFALQVVIAIHAAIAELTKKGAEHEHVRLEIFIPAEVMSTIVLAFLVNPALRYFIRRKFFHHVRKGERDPERKGIRYLDVIFETMRGFFSGVGWIGGFESFIGFFLRKSIYYTKPANIIRYSLGGIYGLAKGYIGFRQSPEEKKEEIKLADLRAAILIQKLGSVLFFTFLFIETILKSNAPHYWIQLALCLVLFGMILAYSGYLTWQFTPSAAEVNHITQEPRPTSPSSDSATALTTMTTGPSKIMDSFSTDKTSSIPKGLESKKEETPLIAITKKLNPNEKKSPFFKECDYRPALIKRRINRKKSKEPFFFQSIYKKLGNFIKGSQETTLIRFVK